MRLLVNIKKSLLMQKKIIQKKRICVSGESDDEVLIKNIYEKDEKKNVKRQIRYPKKIISKNFIYLIINIIY